MATISKSWSTKAQIVGSGDSWSTLSSVEGYSSVVNLQTGGYEGAQVTPEVDAAATPTDDVDVRIYGSLDGTNFDDTPMSSVRVDTATDPNQITIVVRDVAYFRVGFDQTGSTDSHSARCYVNAWKWTSA